jgi:hypothetical protein
MDGTPDVYTGRGTRTVNVDCLLVCGQLFAWPQCRLLLAHVHVYRPIDDIEDSE